MAKIYIVMGAAGEYSSHEEWPICAYTDEDNAKCHADRATEWIHRMSKEYEGDMWDLDEAIGMGKEQKNPFDPTGTALYRGVDYYHISCDVWEVLPKMPRCKKAANKL